MLPARRRSALSPSVLLLLLAACSGGGPAGTAQGAGAAGGASRPWSADLADVVRALEEGRTDLAGARLESLGATPGIEGHLLRARLCALQGDAVAALARIEEARRLSATDPRVYATAAEIYAALGRSSAGEAEIREGLRRAGRTPELERARGVLNLSVPGAARTGLACLERARAEAPDLAFLTHPLAEAHRLVGREELTAGAVAMAATHAAAALALEPGDPDALELLAEAKAAASDFEGALALYAELEAAGRDLGPAPALLHQRAGTFELLRQDRARAAEHYAAARRLGLDDEALGFGATVLDEERTARLDQGIEAFARDDLAGARAAFEAALVLAPEDLEARNHLAAVRFREGDHRGAAEGWSALWATMRARGIALVDPLPLNLARAWRLAGEPRLALAVVEDFLADDPEGRWSAEAREMAERLAGELATASPDAVDAAGAAGG